MRLLEHKPYHQIRIVDVTGEAGVATGLFYRYFSDLGALFREVAEDCIARFDALEAIEHGVARGDWFGRILAHVRFNVQCHAGQPGLMRCIRDLANADVAVRERWQAARNRHLLLLADKLPSLFPGAKTSRQQNEVVVYALGSVGETYLHDYFIDRSQATRLHKLSLDELAEFIALLFYRGLFGKNPPAASLQHAGALLGLSSR